MESLTRFIERRLKLQVNAEKSAVAQPWRRSFLGFTVRNDRTFRRCIADKAIARFKHRVRALTGRHREEPCTAFARRKSAERSSNFGVSGALAFQALPNLFLGAEVRYLRGYEGLALQHFRGEAVFIGPMLYAKLSDHLALSAVFSTQVAGP